MEKYFKYLNKFGFIYPILVVLVTIPAWISLVHKGFFPTNDYIYVARISEMSKALTDGQFPVRWSPDFRYGDPTFNFYAPLPYYIGALIHTLNISFLDTAKILYILSFIFSAVAMYALGKKIFGVFGGIISATLYTYAPYHSVDIYVRGALSEAWALVFFPLIFLATLELAQKVTSKRIAFLSLSLAGLFLTHNIMTILFLPFFAGWVIYALVKNKKIKRVFPIITSILLGFGLASSFLLPAYFEKKFVQTSHLTVGYFDFRAHFVEISQFFKPFWSYGASVWGPEDGISFQIGLFHWFIVAFLIVIFIINFKKGTEKTLVPVLFIAFLFSLFMQHNKSTFIWLTFPLLTYVQFPWRFLGISIFFVSLIGGALMFYWKRFLPIFVILVIIVSILVNVRYFHPESYYEDSIDEHYISEAVLKKDDKVPKDYLPIWVKKNADSTPFIPYAEDGVVKVSNFKLRSDSASFELEADQPGTIQLPITYFPGWQVFLDNQALQLKDPSDLGLIRFAVPSGNFKVRVEFTDTLVRRIGNYLSPLSFLVLIYLFLNKRDYAEK